ncbi:hypothetical protein HDU98_011519 [Podochytrium sp. JEL0797]|nr:hypothetical protein HDU98_011519 [Podochytrium sp. JEL0797]
MDVSCNSGASSALSSLVSHAAGSGAMGFARTAEEQGGFALAGPGAVGGSRGANKAASAAFFAPSQQQMQRGKANPAFEFRNMRNELNQAQAFQSQHQHTNSDFDQAFSRAKGKDPIQSLPQPQQLQYHQQPVQLQHPAANYQSFQQRPTFRHQPQHLPQFSHLPVGPIAPVLATANHHSAFFDQAFEEALSHSQTPTPLQDQRDESAEINITGPDASSLLAQTAGLLIDTVGDNAANPKFANSKFLGFMKQLRDRELGIEGGKVVEMSGPGAVGVEKPPLLSVSDDWVKEVGGGLSGSSGWYMDDEDGPGFGLSERQREPLSWSSDFMQDATNQSQQQQLPTVEAVDIDDVLEDAFQEFYNATGTGPAAKMGHLNPAVLETRAQEWEDLEMSWNQQLDPSNPTTTTRQRDMDFELDSAAMTDDAFSQFMQPRGVAQLQYDFIPNNPYTQHPVSRLKNISTHQNLSDSILSLEAAVQIDPMDATTWKNLGLRQQENENEVAALSALNKAISLDPRLLDSWIALAVSYTNESMYSEAYKALEGWIANNDAYKPLLVRDRGVSQHEFLTGVYIDAVRMGGESEMDPGLQMALGVLFNISGEHDKAMDCFQACLALHPQDYMLWNKLGATLANSKSPHRALEAYGKALQLNPDFLRARYNVAIALIQLGEYEQSVDHLVSILEAQEENVRSVLSSESMGAGGASGGVGGSYEERVWQMHAMSSGSTWSTLWMVADRYLNRPDLAKAADEKNLDAFRK